MNTILRSRLHKVQSWLCCGIFSLLAAFGGCPGIERTVEMNMEDNNQGSAKMKITTVRYNQKQSREILSNFIFGGFRAGRRVPRGIDPELVSDIIKEELMPDSPPDAYSKTVQVLRFYERTDCLQHIRQVLKGQEKEVTDVSRSAYAIQAIAEVGKREEADEAAQYFDTRLAGHSKAIEAADVLLETLVVLSPLGSPERLSKRIAEEVNMRKTGESESEEGMRTYQKVAAIQRLKLPQALLAVEAKKKVLAMEPDQRRTELINIYLGKSNVSDDLMMTWAGRMLRREVMEGNPKPVYAAFSSEIAQVDPKKVGEDAVTDTIVDRAAQAILYLQGKLTKKERELLEKTKLGAMNFLWDDLNL